MSPKRIMLSSIFGNALEFYDFTLYGVFAAVIANQFFPGSDDTAKLLCSLAALAVGFLTRPLGAIIFGHVGDIFGRKHALSFSVLFMGVPTFLIGICPSYADIGITASIIIFCCRILQGIFTGGEYNGAAIFSIEHLGKKYPGAVGGFITGSCVIGAFTATLLGSWTQGQGMAEWAWRIPFILGGAFGVFGYFMRRTVTETPEFISIVSKSKAPLFQALLANPRSSFISFVFGSFNGVLTYTLFTFLNIYLSRYFSIPLEKAMFMNLFGLFAFMVGSPSMGYLLDKLGQRLFLFGTVLSIFVFALPIFFLISSKVIFAMYLGQILLGLCVASIAGTGHAVMQTLFPASDRYSGVSFNFSLGMGIFGGITPMVYIGMIERFQATLFFPAFVLMGFALFFGMIIPFIRENQVAARPLSAASQGA